MNSTPINPATNGEGFTVAAQGRAKKRAQDNGVHFGRGGHRRNNLAIVLSGLYTLLGASVNQ